ncbi:hypothetical protein [Variovorax sp. RO1]|nr:hypothetical protein [Variovorax sp. RO1]
MDFDFDACDMDYDFQWESALRVTHLEEAEFQANLLGYSLNE